MKNPNFFLSFLFLIYPFPVCVLYAYQIFTAFNDAFSFLDYSCDFTSEEMNLKNKINKICKAEIQPIAAEVWEKAKFNKRFISACKKMGKAGFQIRGYGERVCCLSVFLTQC